MNDRDSQPDGKEFLATDLAGSHVATPSPGQRRALPSGPAAAALIAAGVGCLTMGLLTWLGAWSEAISRALTLYEPVGPLSGQSAGAVLLWLLTWAGLHAIWRNRSLNLDIVLITTLFLVGLGILGTFPPFVNLSIAWFVR